MRKIIIFVMALFICGATNAETMCVKLNPASDCTYDMVVEKQSNWTITCNGIEVSGIGYCSSQRADNQFDKSDTITISPTLEENQYCWCKMVSPTVSSWISVGSNGSAQACAQGCARLCTHAMVGSRNMRLALFSDLH